MPRRDRTMLRRENGDFLRWPEAIPSTSNGLFLRIL